MPQRIMMVFLVFWLSVVGIFPAYGAQPLDTLKGPIDKVVAILNDPQYKDSAQRHRQHEHLWQVIREVFDFNMISRLSLARNWKELPPAEQKEFSAVFSEFLGNTYINKIQGEYQDEKVVFMEQEMLTASKAAVKTKIIRKNVEVPIEYPDTTGPRLALDPIPSPQVEGRARAGEHAGRGRGLGCRVCDPELP